MFQWVAKIGCAFGFHRFIPIRYIWVKFHHNLYYKDKYSEEAEMVASRVICTKCGKRIDIDVEL